MDTTQQSVSLASNWVALVPIASILAGQLQLLLRFSRVGGGPGTYRRVFRSRYKQYRSIIIMDAFAGGIAVATIAIIGPTGPLASLFARNLLIGWLIVAALAPFALTGFMRGAVVQGLLKPEWLMTRDGSEVYAAVFGVHVLREEAVDLLVRSLWVFVRDQNRRVYNTLKRCIEIKIGSGDVSPEEFVADVQDFFNKRRVDVPEAVAEAIAALQQPSASQRTNRNRLEKLASALLNSENWEPIERLCPQA